jgi:hypothetical protein
VIIMVPWVDATLAATIACRQLLSRGVYRGREGKHDSGSDPTFTLDVDGELFAVRTVEHPGIDYSDTDYTWLSGPNKGYGFGISGPLNLSLEDHRERVREFLGMVDPTTGYLEED